MATNFPTSVDNFTNPTANDSLNAPSHSVQHANANDAIEAVEDYLLNGAGRTGLVFIASGTASAQNRLNISNCFNSTYANYRVEVTNLSHTTANELILRFSTSGTDYVASGHYTQRVQISGSTTTPVTIAGNYLAPTYINSTANSFAAFSFDIINPFASVPTSVLGAALRLDAGSNIFGVNFNGLVDAPNSFDGISLIGNTGNISGTMRVYGYRN